ncbi:hypothetical protein MKEN_00971400 [Mycena kentingensis (nom. inval.)]|nr:hypothetical protein MKEN_00971400 [Mycena kentingensis (nom. inval.)]
MAVPQSPRAVDRLPPELVAEIFAHTLPHTRNVGSQAIPSAPWTLGHICALWRVAALGYPPLWTEVTLYAAANAPIRGVCPPDLVKTQLQRSGSVAPLHIRFDWSADVNVEAAGVNEVLRLLEQQSERWATLVVDVRGTSPAPLLQHLTLIRGRIPQLERLEVFCPPGIYTIPWARFDMFVSAPRLRQVFLTTPTFSQPSVSLPLPPHQIDTLRVCYLSQQIASDAIRRFPNLESLSLSIIRPFPSVSAPPVVLPRLRHLHLLTWSAILAALTIPALRDLRLGQPVDAGPRSSPNSDIYPLLPLLLRRSGCSLERLAIDWSMDPGPVLEALRQSPALRSLTLTLPHGPGTDALVRALAEDNVCPMLERLDFTIAGAGARQDEALVLGMLQARLGILQYARLTMGLRVGYGDEVDPRVRMLREIGMVVELPVLRSWA